MNVQTLKEKLKNTANGVAAAFDWVGGHLTGLLTLFSVVAGFLFLQERKKAQSLETDVELKDKTDLVKIDLQGVQDAQEQAQDSGTKYDDAKREYDASKGSH